MANAFQVTISQAIKPVHNCTQVSIHTTFSDLPFITLDRLN